MIGTMYQWLRCFLKMLLVLNQVLQFLQYASVKQNSIHSQNTMRIQTRIYTPHFAQVSQTLLQKMIQLGTITAMTE